MIIEKKYEASKEISELGDCIKTFLVKYDEEKAKGTETGPAMMNALSGSITQMFAAIDNIQAAGQEVKENLAASINAMIVPLTVGVCAVIK